jgi:hypothetical protein
MAEHGNAQAALDSLPEVARLAGVKDYQPCSESAAQYELDAGHTAGARLLCFGEPLYPSNLARLPWRLNKMEIVPLFESRMIVLIRRDRLNDFPDNQSLAGKTVAVTLNSSFHSWMVDQNAGPFADNPLLIEALKGRDSIKLVVRKDVDFTVLDADIAVFSMNAYPSVLVPAFTVGPVQKLGWGVAKDNSELAARITSFFLAERADNRSGLNQAWLQHLNVSITEFEALIETMGDPGDGDINDQ